MSLTSPPNKGYINGNQYIESPNYDVQVINGIAHRIHKVVVHTFTMSDVDDPDLYAAEPLWQWQNTEEGKWVMAHAIETPVWHRHNDVSSYTIRYAITAKLRGRDYTFWQLKWGRK